MSAGAGGKVVAPQMDRSHERRAERHELEVTVDFESDSNFYTGLTQNISMGGLFIATHRLHPVGERIKLKFTLPGTARVVTVETEVRWLRETTSLHRADGHAGMGLRFINLPADDRAAIESFIQARDSLYYDDE